MNKVNYFEILKKSWNITWNNKYLWWFGFFLALGINGLNFNGSFNAEKDKGAEERFFKTLVDFSNRHWELTAVLLLVFLSVLILLIILKVISRAGLIRSVAEIEKGKTGSFKAGFREGKKYFWKLLFTSFIIGFFIAAVFIILFSPIAFLIYLKSYILALILGLFAIAIVFTLAILVSFLKEYAYIYLILSGIGVKSALESAYQLFRKNIWTSVVFSLIFIPLGLVLVIMTLFIFIILALFFGIIGLIFYFLFAKIGAIIAAALGILVFIASIIVLQSIFATFKQASWVLFFHEIASIKKEEVIKEELVKVPGKVLEGGEA